VGGFSRVIKVGRRRAVWAAIAVIALPLGARAADDIVWTDGASAGTWENEVDWLPIVLPNATDEVGLDGATNSTTIGVHSGKDVAGSLDIGSKPYTINIFTGGALGLFGAGIIGTSSNLTINTNPDATDAGAINFHGSATAGSATINNGGYLTSSPSPTTVNGTANLFDTTTAGNATITNNSLGLTNFHDNSTAGAAAIFNNAGGTTTFFDSSLGGNATITNNGGTTIFADTSASQNATIDNNKFSFVQFTDNANGSAAAGAGTTILNAGLVDISGATAPVFIGIVSGDGGVSLGANELVLGSGGGTMTIGGDISGFGGQLAIAGGTVTLTGANLYTGLTEVQSGGTLIVGAVGTSAAAIPGNAQVDAGGTLYGNGTIGFGTVTGEPGDTPLNGNLVNSGLVSPSINGVPTTLGVAGAFAQTGGGDLRIVVTPSAISQLNVGAGATIAGTTTFAFGPGTYHPGQSIYLTAGGTITDTSTKVYDNNPAYLTASTVELGDPSLALVLSTLPVPVPTPVPTLVPPRDGALFAEQNLGLLINSLGSVGTLLGEAALGGEYGRPCVQGSPPPPGGGGGPAGTLAATNAAAGLGSAFCGAGGWIDAGGSFFHAPGFATNTGGFMTGIDRPIGESGLRLGVAVGFGATWLSDGQGGNATENVARTGVYGSLPLGFVILDGALGYGHDWNNTMRPTGVGTATASQNGNEYSGGFDARVPLHFGAWTVTPGIGVGAAHVTQPSFSESGPPGMTVTGSGVTYGGTQPYGQFEISRRFTTDGGMVIIPDFRFGYDYNSGSDLSEGLNGNGTPFTSGPVKINPSSGVFTGTVTIDRGWWIVYARYGADLSSNWHEQHVTVNVRAQF
jgi:hypothetical protein